MPIFFYIFIFIIGSFVGSFLNVCIYRLPRRESIIIPSSHCPLCNTPIRCYDNIPLISFIILGGRCRFCKGKITLRYFVVELLTAILFVWFFSIFGPSVECIIFIFLGLLLIVASFIDFEHQIIPDVITLGGLLVGVVISVLYPALHQAHSIKNSLLGSLYGAAVGGGSIYLTGLIGKLIFKKEAMGGGDVKFMAMIVSIVGWQKVLLTFFMAPFFGSVVGIIVLLKNKEHIIPYGPFLSIATFIVVAYGDKILKVFVF